MRKPGRGTASAAFGSVVQRQSVHPIDCRSLGTSSTFTERRGAAFHLLREEMERRHPVAVDHALLEGDPAASSPCTSCVSPSRVSAVYVYFVRSTRDG